MNHLAHLLAVEAFSQDSLSNELVAALWGCDDLRGLSFFSLAWRVNDKNLAVCISTTESKEKSVALYHVRRSLAGKALRAGAGHVVEATIQQGRGAGSRLFDVEAAGARHGIAHMLSVGLALPLDVIEGKGGQCKGVVSFGFIQTPTVGKTVVQAVVQLAAYMGEIMPMHLDALRQDIHDLCPALPPCTGGPCARCARSATARDMAKNPNPAPEPCQGGPPGPHPDSDGSAGTSGHSGQATGELNAAPRPEQPPGQFAGDGDASLASETRVRRQPPPEEVEGEGDTSLTADTRVRRQRAPGEFEGEGDASVAAEKRVMRERRLLRTLFAQHPRWMTFKDPGQERAFILDSAARACARDFGLMAIMCIYITIVTFWRPFYLYKLDPAFAPTVCCFYLTALMMVAYKSWYLKNRALVLVLWMIVLRLGQIRWVLTSTSKFWHTESEVHNLEGPEDVLTILATHWLFMFPVQHAFESIIFVLTKKQHVCKRGLLTILGVTAAISAFPRGYEPLGLSRWQATAGSILNMLFGEGICIWLISSWEAAARNCFARTRASQMAIMGT